jgi:hypothetical protein
MRCEHVYPNCHRAATGHATWDRDPERDPPGGVHREHLCDEHLAPLYVLRDQGRIAGLVVKPVTDRCPEWCWEATNPAHRAAGLRL